MAEKKPSLSYQQKKPSKPRAPCVRNPAFAKDVRINLRKAKFKQKRVTNSEESPKEERLPRPQPKIRLRPFEDEEEKNEESEEEFLSYVKVSASEERNYNFKDEKDCCVGRCKSCGLLSHDLSLINKDVKSNNYDKYERSKEHLRKDELANLLSSLEITETNCEKVSENVDVSKPDESIEHKSVDLSNPNDTKDIKTPHDKMLNSEIKNLEDDLDVLLTLKEPVASKSNMFSQAVITSKVKEPKYKSETVPTKSVDLERWLDSILDI